MVQHPKTVVTVNIATRSRVLYHFGLLYFYNSSDGNTMLAVDRSSFALEKSTNASSLFRTHDSAVYNWPCANGSIRRSKPALERVNPWHPLNVVAYAKRSGNCRHSTVQSVYGG